MQRKAIDQRMQSHHFQIDVPVTCNHPRSSKISENSLHSVANNRIEFACIRRHLSVCYTTG